MLNRKQVLDVLDGESFKFRISVENEMQKPEYFLIRRCFRLWTLQANNKETFTCWTDIIRKAYRPRWVEKSASHCWVRNMMK